MRGQGMGEKIIRIVIPPGVKFSDLQISLNPNGEVIFDWVPIHFICVASGLEINIFTESDDCNVMGLIDTWYRHHVAQGGKPDAAFENLREEARLANLKGQHFIHTPGHA